MHATQKAFRIVLMRSFQITVAALCLLVTSLGPAAAQTWIQESPTGTSPTERYSSGRAYDVIHDRLILFGGEDPTWPRPNDVWVLTNATGVGGTPSWEQLFPTGGPPQPRYGGTVVYDSTSNRLIVYGGCGGNCMPMINDAWVLTNANGLGGTPEWIRLPDAPGPENRRGEHAAVFDPVSNRMIVFAGHNGWFGTDRNDVWVLEDANGIGNPTWEQLSPAGTPPPERRQPGIAYDQPNNRLLVFGGTQDPDSNTTINFNDVWVLTDANGLGGTPQWIQLSTSGTPPLGRFGHSVFFDTSSRRMLIFGGVLDQPLPPVFLNDVWALTEANGISGTPQWIELTPTGGPPLGRFGHSDGYLPSANRMVIAMGRNDSPSYALFKDVWVLTNANGITNQPPVANAGPDQTLECTRHGCARVTLDGSASSDPDGDTLSYEWKEGTTLLGSSALINIMLPLGTHSISLTVDDGKGGTASAQTHVTVRDTTPPTLSVSLSPNVLWPPNSELVPITASIQVSDTCDPNPSVVLVSITSSEPDASGNIQGASLGTDDRSFLLRAERLGGGSGRVYTVSYRAMDASGNMTFSSAQVLVPHDQR